MTELKLGNKYECFNCGAKFYDLAKGSALCPKCGADQKDGEGRDGLPVAQSVKRRRKAELLPQVEVETPDAEVVDDLPVAGVLDDEDLGGLDDEIAEEEEEEEEEEDVDVEV